MRSNSVLGRAERELQMSVAMAYSGNNMKVGLAMATLGSIL